MKFKSEKEEVEVMHALAKALAIQWHYIMSRLDIAEETKKALEDEVLNLAFVLIPDIMTKLVKGEID